VLQQASVVGRLFWDQVVEHIQAAEGGKPQAVPDALGSLRNREMVYRREASAFSDAREYLFKHQGLVDISTQMCGVIFTDYPFTRQLVLMDKCEGEALAQGIITVQELEQLHNFWEQANADGEFFASVSMILVSGRKP
jgi:hypothetical protein